MKVSRTNRNLSVSLMIFTRRHRKSKQYRKYLQVKKARQLAHAPIHSTTSGAGTPLPNRTSSLMSAPIPTHPPIPTSASSHPSVLGHLFAPVIRPTITENEIGNEICKLCNGFRLSGLVNTRNLWVQLASYMADICLRSDQRVNAASCDVLNNFLKKNLSGFPIATQLYCNIPGIELIRDQVTSVLDKMNQDLPVGNGHNQSLANVLNGSVDSHLSASTNGKPILAKMKNVSINHAILQSLFTPHRQIGLPTCNMDAIIVNETLNNPARLARIFRDILTKNNGDEIHLASNATVDKITICPVKISPSGVTTIEVMPNDLLHTDNKTYLLNQNTGKQLAGIDLIYNPTGSAIGLNIPINDLNDAFLQI